MAPISNAIILGTLSLVKDCVTKRQMIDRVKGINATIQKTLWKEPPSIEEQQTSSDVVDLFELFEAAELE